MRVGLLGWVWCAAMVAGCSSTSTGAAGGATEGWFARGGTDAAALTDSTRAKDSSQVADTKAASDAAGAAGDASAPKPKPDLPPEKEQEPEFGAPEGSPHFVYIPDPQSDRVVRIHGATLKVSLIEVGDRPTQLKAVPGHDWVVVLNAGSDELSVIRSTEKGDTVATLPMEPHSNSLLVSPAGTFAAAWFDKERQKAGEPDGSFQALTLVSLADPPQSLTVSVGFRVRAVHFATDGSKAVVVTDDGVSVVKLGEVKDGTIVAPVAVSPDPLSKPKEREVQTTPDAAWALVRESGLKGLYAVHLATKQIALVPLDSVPTDLDLLPGSAGALAVLRDDNAVAFVTLPPDPTDLIAADVVDVGNLTAGLARLSHDGKTAVLYTTVAGIEQVAALDLVTRKLKAVLLKKTVESVVPVLGLRKVMLLHKPAPGPKTDDPVEMHVDQSHGYTLYDLDTGFTKLVLTPVKPTAMVLSAQPARAWLLLPDQPGGLQQVQQADFATFLTQEVTLGSKPTHVTLLDKAAMVAVAQDHPSGRITFVPFAGGEPKTVTGYELNGLVK